MSAEQKGIPHTPKPQESNFALQFVRSTEDMLDAKYSYGTKPFEEAQVDAMRVAISEEMEDRLYAFFHGQVAFRERGAELWRQAIDDALDHKWGTMIAELESTALGMMAGAVNTEDERVAMTYTNLALSLKRGKEG